MINWTVLRVLFFAIFSSMLGAGLVVPLLPSYAHSLGATGLQIGLIFAAFSLSRTLFLPYFGHLSDLKGRKPFITLGLLAYCMASVAYMFSNDVSSLILIRSFQGITAAMILPVAQAYAGELAPKGKEGLVMGVINVSLYGGLSVGPIIGGIMKDLFSIQASFLTMGLVCLSGFLLCLVFLPQRREEPFFAKNKTPVRYRRLLSNRYIFGLFLFRLTYTMCVGTIWAFAPLLAEIEFKMSSLEIGFVITLSVFVSAALMAPMGFVADRLNKRPFILIGGLITVCAMIFFYRGQQPWVFFAGSTLTGIGGGIALPSIMAMSVVVGRKMDSMGTVMAIVTMGHSLAMVIGPILGGFIMDILHVRLAFVGGAAIMLLGTVLVLPLVSGFNVLEKPS